MQKDKLSIFQKRANFLRNMLYAIVISDDKKQLVFKGGTSLMLFYNLQRFSEDLDFSMKRYDLDYIKYLYKSIKNKNYKLSELKELDRVTHFKVYYEVDGTEYDCQIEFSRKDYGIDLNYKLFALGNTSVQVMGIEQNFAHKCCAFIERGSKKNFGRPKGRDVFDIYFYLNIKAPISFEILNKRLGVKNIQELSVMILKKLVLNPQTVVDKYIEEMNFFSTHPQLDGRSVIQNISNVFLSYLGIKYFNMEVLRQIESGDYYVPVLNSLMFRKDSTGKYGLFQQNERGEKQIQIFSKQNKLHAFIQKLVDSVLKNKKIQ